MGYRYDYNKIIDIGTKVEYLKYINYSRNKGETNLLDFNTWKNHLKISSITLFMHISTIIESRENIISDITVDSDENQSFLCGDTFCVHNSPRNIYQSSMGKQAVGMFALSYLVDSWCVNDCTSIPYGLNSSTDLLGYLFLNNSPLSFKLNSLV